MNVTSHGDVPYYKVTKTPSNNIVVLNLSFFVSRKYHKIGATYSVKILHVDVTSHKGVPYFKVTVNSYV